jgi:hypothetical protein
VYVKLTIPFESVAQFAFGVHTPLANALGPVTTEKVTTTPAAAAPQSEITVAVTVWLEPTKLKA